MAILEQLADEVAVVLEDDFKLDGGNVIIELSQDDACDRLWIWTATFSVNDQTTFAVSCPLTGTSLKRSNMHSRVLAHSGA